MSRSGPARAMPPRGGAADFQAPGRRRTRQSQEPDSAPVDSTGWKPSRGIENGMQSETAQIVAAILIGIGATLLMDGWNLVLKRVVGLKSLDYCMLGLWVRHMPRTFRHTSIAAAAPRQGECATGWIAHYSIGISLALAFMVATDDWLARPTLLPALGYGLVTVVFPFFIMQPAPGLGIASAKAAAPAQARTKSVATHLVFGLGLYVGALVVSQLGR
jgi:hypothetical protein